MANPTWPADLPQSPLIDGYQESEPDNLLVSENDIGPPNTRRRSTDNIQPVVWPLLLTSTQLASLKTFIRTTLLSGSLPFDHTDPITSTTTSYIVRKPLPDYIPVSHTKFRANLNLARLP